MTVITIESIKAEHEKLADMIAKLESKAQRTVVMPAAEIKLNDGELYSGIVLGKEGAPNLHLILLPDDAEEISWDDAKEWAAKMGGELPTRSEQALLYANLKDQFKGEWYWSSEQHASNSDYAWGQDFGNGLQGNSYKSFEGRARAVRRLIIL